MKPEEIARTLGHARRNGGGWLCKCPVEEHKKSPRPLSIRGGEHAEIVVHCFAGCAPVEVLRTLRERGLLDNGQGRRRDWKPRRPAALAAPPCDPGKPRRLFDQALPISRTPVEHYLREVRGSHILPPHSAIRFLPAQPPRFPWPSMLALVTAFTDSGCVLTLHFTDLLPDGSGKAPVSPTKRTLAGFPMKGGVVRLTEDAEIATRLGIAEGVEKALSIMTSYAADLGRVEHVWSGLNAGNMHELPVVLGIETLAIYGDKNVAGRKAATALKRRWLDAGREVETHFPPGDDWDEAPS